jgi:hypothetical protein
MNFKHSGATGDIVFSLPLIKSMGGGSLYINPYHEQRALSISNLIEIQPYINSVHVGEPIPPPVTDLDLFRNYAGHHYNLVEAYFKAHNVQPSFNWKDGWLTLPDTEPFIEEPYTVINRTLNYDDPNFDWGKEVNHLLTIAPNCYFLGYKDEFDLFQEKFKTEAIFHDCDFLCAAQMIKNAAMFTGGYSCLATIAQGLGVAYRLVQAPNHTCSTLFIDREKIVNI